jgi:hypothetical protein
MLHNFFVGGDSILKVMGNVIERITGDKKAHTEKDRIVTTEKGVETNTTGSTKSHSEKEVHHNSAEKTKLF